MQVYAASSRNSYARGLSSPLIFADGEAWATCAAGGESRCKITSAKAAAEKKLKELINYEREYRN